MSSTEPLVEPAPESPHSSPASEEPTANVRGAVGRPWVKWTVVGAVTALVLGIGAGLWASQNSSQNEKLDSLIAQQAADKAKASKAAADAQAAQAKAKAKAAADAQALKELAQAQALQKAQKDAEEAKAQAQAAQQQAQANANRPPTVIVPQTPYDASSYRPGYTAVWGSFPLISEVQDSVTVRDTPSMSGTPVGRIYVGESVNVVCSTAGGYVSTAYTGSSSNWDWVTSPTSGWVSDAYVDTRTAGSHQGAVAPRC